MPICSKCPPQEQPLIKELSLLPPRIKHCHGCGRCMERYSITSHYYPRPVYFARREYHFCSQKCSNTFWLYH